MSLVGLGMLAVGILLWYTTTPGAAAVISLLSGMFYIALGVFETIQRGHIGRIGERESGPR